MPARSNEFLLDTNVLEEHLVYEKGKQYSYLELLMQKRMCFTTVLNASDLFNKALSSVEQIIIKDLLSALKILGIHSRYSLLVPKYSEHVKNFNEALFCVVADYNKLHIVTLDKSKYNKSGLTIYHPEEIIFNTKISQ